MGTRSLIGIEIDAGGPPGSKKEIEYIYCHWDGYPSNNGKILLEHYQDADKILELMDLGDISSLRPEIGERQDFNNPHKDWCVSYGRDRGEKDIESCVVDTEDEFRKEDRGSEYKYLFKNDKWYFTTGSHGFVELTQEACKD